MLSCWFSLSASLEYANGLETGFVSDRRCVSVFLSSFCTPWHQESSWDPPFTSALVPHGCCWWVRKKGSTAHRGPACSGLTMTESPFLTLISQTCFIIRFPITREHICFCFLIRIKFSASGEFLCCYAIIRRTYNRTKTFMLFCAED